MTAPSAGGWGGRGHGRSLVQRERTAAVSDELGAASLTVMDTLVVALPLLLLANRVGRRGGNAVGVPDIAPLVVENDSPAGSDGEIDQM